jgi:EmrB/QacA subfamily drug resistance transporter
MAEATMESGRVAAAAGPAPAQARRWWVLAILAIAQLMIVLDVTVVNIALPSAQKALHFSDADRQWIITAYALAFGSLLLVGGRIGDLLGRKRLFIAGAFGFAAASALGGAAQNFELLVGARALQGVFAALMAPAALSLVSTTFTDARERGIAFGIWGGIGGGAGAIGLLLGGVLTQSLSWRWTLYVNLAFAIPAAIGAIALLRPDARRASTPIDVPGAVTATGGLFALVYGFAQAETHGWGSSTTVAFLVAGALLLAAFAAIQIRAAHPLLPPRVVLDRNRGGSVLILGLLGLAVFAAFLFLTYYLQQTKGYSPSRTGIAYLPLTALIVITASVTNARLLPRTGPRPPIVLGMVLAAVSFVLFAQLDVHSSYATGVLPGLLVMAVGVGLVFAPATDIATRGVNTADAGVTSALPNAATQVGGSLGVALLSTFSATAASNYLAARDPNPSVIAHAAVHGYTTAFWWAAGIFAAGAVIGALLLRPGAARLATDTEPEAAPSQPPDPAPIRSDDTLMHTHHDDERGSDVQVQGRRDPHRTVTTATSSHTASRSLAESRARIVATADETRRRIERDLHDGSQQRLVTLALELQAIKEAVPPERPDLLGQLTHIEEGLRAALRPGRRAPRGGHRALPYKARDGSEARRTRLVRPPRREQ